MSLGSSGWEQQRLFPVMLEYRLVSWSGRVSGFALLGAIALMWACLVSWSSTDPSLTHTTAEHARNYLGAPGALISDLLFQTLGLASLIILLPPMFWGLELVKTGRVPGFPTKAACYPLAVLVLSGSLSAIPAFETWPMANGYGGILGDLFFSVGASLLSAFNADRAALATGILLLGLGFAALAGSLGLQTRELIALMWRARSQHVLRELAGTWQQSMWAEAQRLRTSAFPGMAVPFGAAAPGAAAPAASFPTAASFPAAVADMTAFAGQRPAEPIEPVLPDPRPVKVAEPAPVPVAAAPAASDAMVAEARLPEPVLPEPAARVNSIDAPRPMRAEPRAPGHSGGIRHDDTDEGSRAMAMRFAPANARAATGELHIEPAVSREQPQPMPEPVKVRQPHAERREPQLPARPAKQWAGLQGPRNDSRGSRPSLNLLERQANTAAPAPRVETGAELAQRLVEVLALYGVHGEVRDVTPGPLVTLIAFEPARGIKLSRVVSLADDIARCLGVASARIAPLIGSSVLGIELPNAMREPVKLREVLEARAFRHASANLPIALGRSIAGEAVVLDLADMPYLLIAGGEAAARSNLLQALLMSLLFRQPANECRLMLVGSRAGGLKEFEGVPHLMEPVVTADAASAALRWLGAEIQERQKRLAKLGVRSIETYNNRIRNARERGEAMQRVVQTGFDRTTGSALYEMQPIDADLLPRIVVVLSEIGELGDTCARDLEALVQKLAPVAASIGIHAVLATERASNDVLTAGLLAAQPVRVALKVATKLESRAVLDAEGAERLLGENDMLYASGSGQIVRVHAPAVTEKEVLGIASFLRRQNPSTGA